MKANPGDRECSQNKAIMQNASLLIARGFCRGYEIFLDIPGCGESNGVESQRYRAGFFGVSE